MTPGIVNKKKNKKTKTKNKKQNKTKNDVNLVISNTKKCKKRP